ncbi:MAG TPA: SMP-30/gluconolactonase/LRE family protein [Terriglobales bacterium]|nr:SMP-30/gluconolactonase/LRE family protein [Terriglobales bacterium]
MGISERLLGKRQLNGKPHISSITPQFALPGGEVRISGTGLRGHDMRRPLVKFGDEQGGVVISSDDFVVARVPESANSGPVVVVPDEASSNSYDVRVAVPIAENLHPVTNPAIDHEGSLFVTFSGSRGQKVPVSIYKIDTGYHVKPFLSELMNAHGIAFDREGQLYVSSRQNGTVYRVAPNGTMSAYAEGMGIATGIAFDREQNLYVGDRSGTIFKIARDRQTFVFSTLEPSVSAYHLAFGPDQNLYVSGPTTSSYDAIYRVDPHGDSSVFFRGLGRPQGMAFDANGNLYVAASYAGKRGIIRITPDKQASLCVSGQNLVGLCFAPGRAAVLATTSAVFHLSWNIQGLPLLP